MLMNSGSRIQSIIFVEIEVTLEKEAGDLFDNLFTYLLCDSVKDALNRRFFGDEGI